MSSSQRSRGPWDLLSAPTPCAAAAHGRRRRLRCAVVAHLTLDPDAATQPEVHRPVGRARLLASVLGLLGAFAAIAVPFLPVHERTASLQWPQQSTVADVSAPLVAYAPQRLDLTVPCAAFTGLAAAGGGTVVSTVPAGAPLALAKGLVVSVRNGNVDVAVVNRALLTTSVAGLTGPGCALRLTSTATATTVQLAGQAATVTEDLRPQVTGVYSDLTGAVPAGLSLTATIDTRFSTSPTLLKLIAMGLGAVCAVGAVVALHSMDARARHRASRLLHRRWWRPTTRDVVVIATLTAWHIIGANTTDDGYLLTLARTARSSGYLANYYRWLGVPEAPFGWAYDLIDVMSRVSTASPWLRLPALIMGILTWLTLSREVLPRLGHSVKRNLATAWTAATVFLAFWLPYNNGLRPEPLIALGVIVTWCAVERSIASERLLPAALALIVSAFTLAAGPTGLICLLPVLAGIKPLLALLRRRAAQVGWLPTLAPMLAAGFVVLVVIFADQTLAAVLEGTKVRSARGPNFAWYYELVRYDILFGFGSDGSLARRFPVLVVMVSLVVCTAVMLRRRKLPGAPPGPSRRLIATTAGSFGVLVVTPTKWSHHFGAFAGIGVALAALTAVAVGASVLRSRRNRALFLAGLLGALAFTFAGWNDWVYTARWGIPWFDRAPSLAGIQVSTVIIVLEQGAAGLALFEHLRFTGPVPTTRATSSTKLRLRHSPLAIVAGLMVLAEVLSFTKAAVQRWPNYTIASANIAALGGHPCSLADAVRVETQPFSGTLATMGGSGNGLEPPGSTGFSTRGLPPELDPMTANQYASSAKTQTARVGLYPLPAGLEPGRTPVVGSWTSGTQRPAQLTTSWYRLPPAAANAPLLVVSAAGTIAGTDTAGIRRDGVSVLAQFGRTSGSTVQQLSTAPLLDPQLGPGWRDLRLPLSTVPRGADLVRVQVVDDKLDPNMWAAITQPRVPQLTSLQAAVGRAPSMIDWPVGLEFPCLRPFAVHNGVAEMPTTRVLPPGALAVAAADWQNAYGGGPLGWLDLVAAQQIVPTYLAGDWGREWGNLARIVPSVPQATPAQIATGSRTVWGMAQRGPMLGLR